MERYNIYAVNVLGVRVFNLGITVDRTEKWVIKEVKRLNSLDREDIVYGYEEV